eukprot:651363-Pyramimonas_sp.AAC.1
MSTWSPPGRGASQSTPRWPSPRCPRAQWPKVRPDRCCSAPTPAPSPPGMPPGAPRSARSPAGGRSDGRHASSYYRVTTGS